MLYNSGWLHGYYFLSDSIDLGSKEIHKVITAVLLDNVCLFMFCFSFILATLLNKNLGLCLFYSRKR